MQHLGRLQSRGGETVVRTAPIQELIGYALRRAHGVVYADLNDALARISLRPLQYTMMLMVAENPGASQSSVCEALGMQKANCVPTMSELERLGYIIRRKSASDARSYELHITNKGRRILQRAGELHSLHEQRLIERIGPDGREQLLSLLGKLTETK
ncbi:MAG TPA: MarR family winged helix-turn-helix transcriptional regulator [Steroidobacteraceae bacterium]